jgi:hypothetical protein
MREKLEEKSSSWTRGARGFQGQYERILKWGFAFLWKKLARNGPSLCRFGRSRWRFAAIFNEVVWSEPDCHGRLRRPRNDEAEVENAVRDPYLLTGFFDLA